MTSIGAACSRGGTDTSRWGSAEQDLSACPCWKDFVKVYPCPHRALKAKRPSVSRRWDQRGAHHRTAAGDFNAVIQSPSWTADPFPWSAWGSSELRPNWCARAARIPCPSGTRDAAGPQEKQRRQRPLQLRQLLQSLLCDGAPVFWSSAGSAC